MRVADAVGRALAQLGVRRVFGLIGSGNFHVTNALCAAGADFVAARHEGGAIVMADAWARITGEVGVCSVHQGPGLTNTVTGLTEAAKARTPLLVLAADTAAAAIRSNFRVDQAGLAEVAGAVAERVHGPASALADLARAWRRARVERRPVVLLLPLDVQAAELPAGVVLPEPLPLPHPPAPSARAVAEVAELLASAQRPVLLAGRGAVVAGAREPLEWLGDRVGALLATSANGNGLFAGSPWSLGISGGFATPLAIELLPQADVMVTFGAALNMWTTRHGSLVGPDTTVVQVDLDPDAVGAHHPAHAGVVADASAAASGITAALEQRGHESAGWRSDELAARIRTRTWRDEPYDDASTGDRIDPRTLSIALADLLPAERTLAIDSGHFMGYPAMYWPPPDPDGFVFTQAFQSIGLGLASAVGAAVARPDRVAIAALGDGGAVMALPELETAARLALPLLIVVYNDAAYGAEVHHFASGGDPLDLVRFPDTDFAALGRAAGAAGITVRTTGDLDPVVKWLTSPDRPLVVDAKVVPTVVAEWLEDAFRGH